MDGTRGGGSQAEELSPAPAPDRFAHLVASAARGDPRWLRGTWWGKDDTQSLAVTERIAQRLHLHLGSRIVLTSNARTIAGDGDVR